MSKKILPLTLLVGVAVLNMAVVRKTEDPIRDTQTDPILYKQKMEEEKDGKKGPLAYSVKNNPPDTFLTASPFAPAEEEAEKEMSGKTAPAGLDWWEEPVTMDPPLAADTGDVDPAAQSTGIDPFGEDLFKKAAAGMSEEDMTAERPSETPGVSAGPTPGEGAQEPSSSSPTAPDSSGDSWW